MIEEIKKEIDNLDYGNLFDSLMDKKDARFVYLRDVFKILDKYNNQPDKELSKKYNLDKE